MAIRYLTDIVLTLVCGIAEVIGWAIGKWIIKRFRALRKRIKKWMEQ